MDPLKFAVSECVLTLQFQCFALLFARTRSINRDSVFRALWTLLQVRCVERLALVHRVLLVVDRAYCLVRRGIDRRVLPRFTAWIDQKRQHLHCAAGHLWRGSHHYVAVPH